MHINRVFFALCVVLFFGFYFCFVLRLFYVHAVPCEEFSGLWSHVNFEEIPVERKRYRDNHHECSYSCWHLAVQTVIVEKLLFIRVVLLLFGL